MQDDRHITENEHGLQQSRSSSLAHKKKKKGEKEEVKVCKVILLSTSKIMPNEINRAPTILNRYKGQEHPSYSSFEMFH